MDWSTRSVNDDLMDAVKDVCYTQTGVHNTWQDKQGARWLYLIPYRELSIYDDSLFGDIYRQSEDSTHATHAGTFHIKSGSLIQSHKSFSGIFTLAQSMGKLRRG